MRQSIDLYIDITEDEEVTLSISKTKVERDIQQVQDYSITTISGCKLQLPQVSTRKKGKPSLC